MFTTLDDTRSTARLAVVLLLVIMAGHFPVEWLIEHFLDEELPFWEEFVAEAAVLALITGTMAWTLIVMPLRRAATQEHAARRSREAQLRAEACRQAFVAAVHRALEMADDEHGVLRVLRRAIVDRSPRRTATLLLSDHSDSRLEPVVQAGPEGAVDVCRVERPRDCPAVRQSRTQRFADPDAIDACPHLPVTTSGVTVCVPMSAAGRAVGVLHSVVPADDEQAHDDHLETLVDQAGARLGLLRVIKRTALQASTDSLTGLHNRRAIEDRAAELLQRHTTLAVAVGDLDHFKLLNDAHGHETGDRALRLFARTIVDSVREADLVARYGGEEFLLVFPSLTAPEARDVLQRCQEELMLRLSTAHVPQFTASYGVTDTSLSTSLHTLISIADRALFAAKRAGRDRIMIFGDEAVDHDTTSLAPSTN